MIAQWFGLIGLGFIVLAWQFRARRTILAFNICAFLLFAIEQYMLDQPVGSIMMIGAVTVAAAGLRGLKLSLSLALISAPLLLALPLAKNWYDLLPLIAHCTGAIAFLQPTTIRLRMWAPVGTILWALFNVIVGAWWQFIADLFILTSMAVGHYRNAGSSSRRIAQNPDELP